MSLELSKEQIQELLSFVEKKHVRYLDVQYELVDHLASAIEDEIATDSSLDFQSALKKVYSRFPITGFDQFVTAKEKAMHKYWNRRKWHILSQYFSLPKLIMTIMLFILFGSLTLIKSDLAIWVIIAANLITLVYVCILGFKIDKKNYKKYLVLTKFYQVTAGTIAVPMIFINNLPGWNKGQEFISLMDWRFLAIVGFCTLSSILIHAFVFEFPKIIKEEIANKYAHLKVELV